MVDIGLFRDLLTARQKLLLICRRRMNYRLGLCTQPADEHANFEILHDVSGMQFEAFTSGLWELGVRDVRFSLGPSLRRK